MLPWQHDTPLVIDSLEHLSLQLSDTLPEGIISQMLISSDRFLGYAWSRHLFVGKRTATFGSLEAASYRLNDRSLTSLIVDMESLTTSRFAALMALRAHCLSKGGLRTYLLISHQDPPMHAFLSAAGPFEPLARNLPVQLLREALLAPPLPKTVPCFSSTEWQLITLLAQGLTLKNAARQIRLPYHRAVYRISTLLQRLGLPGRQSLTQLLHRLTLDVNH
jgi:fimbrial protein FimY